jgi:hypothetical protein
MLFRTQGAWNNIYPIFVATSTSPQCILDHHRSIAAHIDYKGILKIGGALTLHSKTNSVNQGGQSRCWSFRRWMRQRRQQSLLRLQSRCCHRGPGRPAGDRMNKMVSVWSSAPFSRCSSAAFTRASRVLQHPGTNLVHRWCTLIYQYLLYLKRSRAGMYSHLPTICKGGLSKLITLVNFLLRMGMDCTEFLYCYFPIHHRAHPV